jgi:UDP-glucuronate 4-epimerase
MTNRDIYCVGYGKQVELLHFIGQIEKNLDKTAIKIFADKHPADAKETWSDTTKLKRLGFEPKTSIEEGVKKFVQWYTEYYA